MSVVINMQQRRTVATGRQNQDPNTAVEEKEHTPKKLCPKIERSIQEVLNHTRNTSGRGRQMVLAALQKKAQAATVKKSPQSAAKTPQSGTDARGSLKSNGHKGSKATPLTPKGTEENRLSITDIRKRPLDPVERREPLSATAHNRPEKQWPDWTNSPGKPAQKEEIRVYEKRPKVETALAKDSTSSDLSQEVFSIESPHQVQKPTQKSEAIIAKPAARRQLMTPSPTKVLSDPYAISPAKSPLPTDLEREPASNVSLNSVPLEIEAEQQPFSFIPKGLKKFHGLMNLGNTCYMNVVVQILYSLPSFVCAMERLSTNFLRQDATNTEDLPSEFQSIRSAEWPIFMEHSSDIHGYLRRMVLKLDSEVLPSPSNDSVFAALLQVFLDLRGAGRFETVNPSILKRAFAKRQASFWGSVQQDAHEFLCSLIDHVQEEVSSLLRRQSDNQADCLKLDTVCPTTQNFSCTVRNSLTCAECGNVSSVEETYRDFSLALPEDERNDDTKVCSLESLLRLYFQETTMLRKCENCGGGDAKAQAQVLKLPHVLVLQLKRLHMDRDVPCTKISAPVNFTPYLDIGAWCAKDHQKFWSPTNTAEVNGSLQTCPTFEILESDSASEEFKCEVDMDHTSASTLEIQTEEKDTTKDVSTLYRLHGVVNHLGNEASGGHFVTNILDAENDTWIRCDDSLVMDVAAEAVFNKVREAYMFFYVHEPALLSDCPIDGHL